MSLNTVRTHRESGLAKSLEFSKSFGTFHHLGGHMAKIHQFQVETLWEERVHKSLKLPKPEESKGQIQRVHREIKRKMGDGMLKHPNPKEPKG
jgi:hypothetical protein